MEKEGRLATKFNKLVFTEIPAGSCEFAVLIIIKAIKMVRTYFNWLKVWRCYVNVIYNILL
ncbi:MAG: hypothetical protein EOO93_27870 [Pedobacter sp.]|nr:MAG: hypothetical protein EOO93_27870 [Pedobacter sp.]